MKKPKSWLRELAAKSWKPWTPLLFHRDLPRIFSVRSSKIPSCMPYEGCQDHLGLGEYTPSPTSRVESVPSFFRWRNSISLKSTWRPGCSSFQLGKDIPKPQWDDYSNRSIQEKMPAKKVNVEQRGTIVISEANLGYLTMSTESKRSKVLKRPKKNMWRLFDLTCFIHTE